MNEIILSVMSDGSVQSDRPEMAALVADLNKSLKLRGIVSPTDVVDEINRLAPTARTMTTQ